MFFLVFWGGVAAVFTAAIAKLTALTINIMISSHWEEMLSLWSCLLFSSQATLRYSAPAVTKWSGLLVNLWNWVIILKVTIATTCLKAVLWDIYGWTDATHQISEGSMANAADVLLHWKRPVEVDSVVFSQHFERKPVSALTVAWRKMRCRAHGHNLRFISVQLKLVAMRPE